MIWKPLLITVCGSVIAIGSLVAWAQVPGETKSEDNTDRERPSVADRVTAESSQATANQKEAKPASKAIPAPQSRYGLGGSSNFSVPARATSSREDVEATEAAILAKLAEAKTLSVAVEGASKDERQVDQLNARERESLARFLIRQIHEDKAFTSQRLEWLPDQKVLVVYFSPKAGDEYTKDIARFVDVQLLAKSTDKVSSRFQIPNNTAVATPPSSAAVPMFNSEIAQEQANWADDHGFQSTLNNRFINMAYPDHTNSKSRKVVPLDEAALIEALTKVGTVGIFAEDQYSIGLNIRNFDAQARKDLASAIFKAKVGDAPAKPEEKPIVFDTEANVLSIWFSSEGYEQYGKYFNAVYKRLFEETQARVNGSWANRVDELLSDPTTPSQTSLANPASQRLDSRYGNRLRPGYGEGLSPGKKVEAEPEALAAALRKAQAVVLVVDRKRWEHEYIVDDKRGIDAETSLRLARVLLAAIDKDPNVEGNRIETHPWRDVPDGAVHIFLSSEGYDQYGQYLPSLVQRLFERYDQDSYKNAVQRIEELLGAADQPAGSSQPQLAADDANAELQQAMPTADVVPMMADMDVMGGGPVPNLASDFALTGSMGMAFNSVNQGKGYSPGPGGKTVEANEAEIEKALQTSEYLLVVVDRDKWFNERKQYLDATAREKLAQAIVRAFENDPNVTRNRVELFPIGEGRNALHLHFSQEGYDRYGRLLTQVLTKLSTEASNRLKSEENQKISELLSATKTSRTPSQQSSSENSFQRYGAGMGQRWIPSATPPSTANQYPSGVVGSTGWLQPDFNNLPTINSPQGMQGSSYAPSFVPNQVTDDQQYRQLEAQAASLALRVKQAVGKPEEEDRLAEELRAVVKQAFERRLETQRQQLDQAEAKLKASREHLQKREEHAEQIITRRVEDLTGNNPFPWNDASPYQPAYGTPPNNSGPNFSVPSGYRDPQPTPYGSPQPTYAPPQSNSSPWNQSKPYAPSSLKSPPRSNRSSVPARSKGQPTSSPSTFQSSGRQSGGATQSPSFNESSKSVTGFSRPLWNAGPEHSDIGGFLNPAPVRSGNHPPMQTQLPVAAGEPAYGQRAKPALQPAAASTMKAASVSSPSPASSTSDSSPKPSEAGLALPPMVSSPAATTLPALPAQPTKTGKKQATKPEVEPAAASTIPAY